MAEEIKSNSYGIASFVLGILSIVLFLAPYISIFLGILAIVFARIQEKTYKNSQSTAGFICGIIGTVLAVIMLLFLVAMFVIASQIQGN
jgi:flagellar biosynthesis protein FlhB